jgi:hypothetical protein
VLLSRVARSSDQDMYIAILCIFLALLVVGFGFLSPSISLSSLELKVAQDIQIRFLMEWIVETDEIITIKLPRFTRSTGVAETVAGSSLLYGSVVISPSLTFTAEWNEVSVE